ncbi:MAG: hypothetical protein QOG87_1616 [Actinomycetota bacterium]|jgi:hypothetical protein
MTQTVIELDGPAAPRAERWAKRILATSTMVLLSASLVGLAVVGNTKGVSPAKELARVQAFVEQATSARMVATSTSEQRTGDGELGSSFKDTSRMQGALALPDRSQWVEEDGVSAYETIVVPGAAYYREAESREELAAEQWVHEAIEPTRTPGLSVSPDLMPVADVAGAFAAGDLIELLDAASAPTRVGPHTIKVSIDVSKLEWFEFGEVRADGEPEPAPPVMTAEITSTSEGRLDRLVMRFNSGEDSEGGFSDTTDLRFSNWGSPVTITAPDAAAIDPTPGIAENALAAFDAMPLYGLRRLPAGWELFGAEVWTTEENADTESGDCPEVSLSYGNPAEMEAFEQSAASVTSDEEFETMTWPATIDVSLTPAGCDSWNVLEGGEPITLGGRRGTIVRSTNTEEEYATSIQLVVGTTRMLIESDGPEAPTLSAASDVVPFDLATQPVHHEPPPGA